MNTARRVLPVIIVALPAACGGGGTTLTPEPPVSNPAPVDPAPGAAIPDGALTCVWTGETTSEATGSLATEFNLSQTGNDITGTITYTQHGDEYGLVRGVVDNGTFRLEIKLSHNPSIMLLYTYVGTYDPTAGLAGQLTITTSGEGDTFSDKGTFSVTKQE